MLSTTGLIARRTIELQKRREDLSRISSKVYAERSRLARIFERDHQATMKDYNFERGRLVLMRNTAIEKSLDRKMKPRYLGLYTVVARNRGGAYILAELNGAVFDRPVAAFRVIPYLARAEPLSVPSDVLDVNDDALEALQDSDDDAIDELDELAVDDTATDVE